MTFKKRPVRKDCLIFAQINGLQAKGDKHGIVTLFAPKTNWVDCFEGWQALYDDFLLKAKQIKEHTAEYPWSRKKVVASQVQS